MWICAYTIMVRGNTMRDFIKAVKALSDETRLRILKVLLERECCVCEVMQALDISQSRASRNLGILQNAGFLKERRDGLWIVYSVDWQTVNQYAASLARLLEDVPIDSEVLEQDKERLSCASRVGTGSARES
jgi:ArsR family transcriptional regulator